MAFSFFGTPDKSTDDVIKSATRLKTLMGSNFDATNSLINLLNENAMFNPPVDNVRIDPKSSIKDNTSTLITVIVTLHQRIESVHAMLRNELDRQAYERLLLPHLHVDEMTAIAKRELQSHSVNITTGGLLMVAMIMKKQFLPAAVARFQLLESLRIAQLPFELLGINAKAITKATAGSDKREAYEETIREFDKALGIYGPTTNEYQHPIYKMKAILEVHLERLKNF